MSREQALAFVQALIGSPKMKCHLEAILGYQGSPDMEDFESMEETAVERCGDLIVYLDEAVGTLRALQRTRGRQAEIDMSSPASDPPDAPPSDDSDSIPEIEEKPELAKKLRRGASRVSFGS